MESRSRNVLTMREQFELIEAVKAGYAQSKMTDEEFAEHLNKEMENRFRGRLSKHHVRNAREAFGIPPNFSQGNPGVSASATQRLAELENRVAALEAWQKRQMRSLEE